MFSRTVKAVVVGVALAGFSAFSAAPASGITWIIRNDDKQVGNEPGSKRPCEVAKNRGNGATHQVLGPNEVCWVVHPQAVEDHVNPNAIKGEWVE